jgi:hypothetical protein
MSDLPDVHVLAINITQRIAVAEEGLGDIHNFLDEFADETDDVQNAKWVVVEWRFGGWTSIPMDDYHAPTHGFS